jgi:hypothetical protein
MLVNGKVNNLSVVQHSRSALAMIHLEESLEKQRFLLRFVNKSW